MWSCASKEKEGWKKFSQQKTIFCSHPFRADESYEQRNFLQSPLRNDRQHRKACKPDGATTAFPWYPFARVIRYQKVETSGRCERVLSSSSRMTEEETEVTMNDFEWTEICDVPLPSWIMGVSSILSRQQSSHSWTVKGKTCAYLIACWRRQDDSPYAGGQWSNRFVYLFVCVCACIKKKIVDARDLLTSSHISSIPIK